jgi:hypothetical protein
VARPEMVQGEHTPAEKGRYVHRFLQFTKSLSRPTCTQHPSYWVPYATVSSSRPSIIAGPCLASSTPESIDAFWALWRHVHRGPRLRPRSRQNYYHSSLMTGLLSTLCVSQNLRVVNFILA